MTIFSFRNMSRNELDFHLRCARSPSYRPIPEVRAEVDLPATEAEESAYAARRATRAAGAPETTPAVPPGRGGRGRTVRWLRRVVLERRNGRSSSSEEGVGVGAV